MVWRKDFESDVAAPLNQAVEKKCLMFIPAKGSQVAISSYNVMPLENGLNIAVFGSIDAPEGHQSYTFSQFFTLENICDRFFITADSFNLNECGAVEINEEEFFQLQTGKPKRAAAQEEPKKEGEEAEPTPAVKPRRNQSKNKNGKKQKEENPYSWKPQ